MVVEQQIDTASAFSHIFGEISFFYNSIYANYQKLHQPHKGCQINMLDQMKALARGKNMCVLATDAGGKPYCSLMAYVTDKSCEEIYMVTHRNTQKYKNLMENPAVSLLIDSREKTLRGRVQALTVEGSFHKIEDDAKRTKVRKILIKTHPQLADFIDHADSEIFCIKVCSFLLLNGLSEAHYQEL
jgi:nitroimidazol reductase NimA-like FMN-containing flavoprotein (pyridoxamine 5'-phosphate oxidase superfamily)